MTQPNAGTGTKTQTHHINGQTYQSRLIGCGKDACKVCQSAGGHPAVYRDTGNAGGKRWEYVGAQLPDHDPDYTPPTCDYCGEPLTNQRRGARFCTTAHRVAWHRQQRAEPQPEPAPSRNTLVIDGWTATAMFDEN